MKEEHINLRKKTRSETRQRRKDQVCKVYEIKIDNSHLSKKKLNHFNRLFLEAKWLYNNILSSDSINKYDTKNKTVNVLNKGKEYELRELSCLFSHIRQDIRDRMIWSLKALSSSKKKGEKVGKLKFRSRINSIPLRQINHTYYIKDKKYIKIQGLKEYIKVNGLKQIPENAEFANAILLRKPSGLYFKITCFLSKEEKEKTGNKIGLDFGIKTAVTDSNGNKFYLQFPESKQIKKFSRKMNKGKKGGSNRYKNKQKLELSYEKLTNKKQDAKKKFVSSLVKNNDLIVVQDENIAAWHKSKMRGFGRKVQHSIMGGIISDLKKKSETLVIDRFFPSTQFCPKCGTLNKHGLEDRVYSCACGYKCDRDTHAARNILREGLRICAEHTNKMLDEKNSSTSILNGKKRSKNLFKDSRSQ